MKIIFYTNNEPSNVGKKKSIKKNNYSQFCIDFWGTNLFRNLLCTFFRLYGLFCLEHLFLYFIQTQITYYLCGINF